MGGADSEVSEETTSVILEVACFDPATIAYMSRRHLLRTDASARFERGTDPNGVLFASQRAAKLMAEHAGARASARVADEYPARVEPVQLRLRPQRTNAIVGAPIRKDLQVSTLRSIGLDVATDTEALAVTVPTFRRDLTREIDLIEEVARLVGFESVPSTIPPGRSGGLTEPQATERKLKTTLVGLGLHEAWTTTFASARDHDDLGLAGDHPARRAVRLANPMTAEETHLRTTLLAGLLRSAGRNFAHRVPSVALFETGRVFEPTDEDLPQEAPVLAAVCSGPRTAQGWRWPEEAWDFFAIKGVLEALGAAFRAPDLGFAPVTGAPFHPTRAARVTRGETVLGALGEIHPDVCERFGVPEGTVALEVSLNALLANLPGRPRVEQLPKFPSVFLDLAVVVDDAMPAARVQEAIVAAGAPDVSSVRLFDLYRGDQIGPGKKSLAYALEIRAADRTLTDDEATAVRDRIVAALQERTGAQLRT